MLYYICFNYTLYLYVLPLRFGATSGTKITHFTSQCNTLDVSPTNKPAEQHTKKTHEITTLRQNNDIWSIAIFASE